MNTGDEIVAAIGATDGSVPQVRELRRRYSKQFSNSSGEEMLRLAHRLIRGDDLARFVAYELVHFHAETPARIGEREVRTLGAGMQSWGAVDSFAFYIAGPAWKRGQIDDGVIASWARSTDRWWRRAALASTVTLNRKPVAKNNVRRTLAICSMLKADRDDMVVKALSWALRELAKVDAAVVKRFLDDHDAILAARVKREVLNKLRTGLKAPKARP